MTACVLSRYLLFAGADGKHDMCVEVLMRVMTTGSGRIMHGPSPPVHAGDNRL